MEKSLWTVGLGTITISTTSAFVTGLYGIIRNAPHTGILVGAAAINSGITAGIREFCISPILTHVAPWKQYVHRRQQLGIGNSLDVVLPPPSETLSWSDLRTNRLFDSGIAGAVTGGLLRGLKSRHAIVSGAVTASTVCIVLQYACNELGIARLRYVSKLQEENKSQSSFKPQNGKQVYEPSGSVFQQLLLKAVGLVQISDEEYLAKLKRTREVYLKRMVELEKQVEEEENTKMSKS